MNPTISVASVILARVAVGVASKCRPVTIEDMHNLKKKRRMNPGFSTTCLVGVPPIPVVNPPLTHLSSSSNELVQSEMQGVSSPSCQPSLPLISATDALVSHPLTQMSNPTMASVQSHTAKEFPPSTSGLENKPGILAVVSPGIIEEISPHPLGEFYQTANLRSVPFCSLISAPYSDSLPWYTSGTPKQQPNRAPIPALGHMKTEELPTTSSESFGSLAGPVSLCFLPKASESEDSSESEDY